MRLIFVHGINHQNRSSTWVKEAWLAALKDSMAPADYAVIAGCEIDAPYYGEVLYRETEGTAAGAEPVAMSVGLAEDDEADFLGFALQEAAMAYGVTEADIEAAEDAGEPIPQGFPHDRRLIALVRALENVSPAGGKILLRVLVQAFTYLRKPRARSRVDNIVRPALNAGPCIVVGHSLGAAITFNLLRDAGAPSVPFYMTIGCPLGVKAVQAALGRPFKRPDNVAKWLNGLDRDDFVTLGRSLKQNTFGPGVDNIADIENGDDDPHDFNMYLRDKRLRDALVAAIRAAP